MKYILLVCTCLLFIPTGCENENCHSYISIKNRSSQQVVFATLISGTDGCVLDGKILESGEVIEYSPFVNCIENWMRANQRVDLYFVDPEGYHSEQMFDCDSADAYNDILVVKSLTQKELENMDFQVSYP